MLSGSFGFARVHSGATSGRPIHSRLRGLIRAGLSFFGFIRDRLGLLGRT